ncbi:unnamed protein product [Rhodiola kirilowii]
MRLRSCRLVPLDGVRNSVPIERQLPLLMEVDVDEKLDMFDTKKMVNSTDLVPIPGVREVPSYEEEHTVTFSRPPEAYITVTEDEVFRALRWRRANYDMDDEDEDWLSRFNAGVATSCSVSDETFELVIDAIERAFYCSRPGEYKYSKVQSGLCAHLCSEDVTAALYGYWVKKRRRRRRSALVNVFEANKRPKKTRGRRKKSMQLADSLTNGKQQTHLTWSK